MSRIWNVYANNKEYCSQPKIFDNDLNWSSEFKKIQTFNEYDNKSAIIWYCSYTFIKKGNTTSWWVKNPNINDNMTTATLNIYSPTPPRWRQNTKGHSKISTNKGKRSHASCHATFKKANENECLYESDDDLFGAMDTNNFKQTANDREFVDANRMQNKPQKNTRKGSPKQPRMKRNKHILRKIDIFTTAI